MWTLLCAGAACWWAFKSKKPKRNRSVRKGLSPRFDLYAGATRNATGPSGTRTYSPFNLDSRGVPLPPSTFKPFGLASALRPAGPAGNIRRVAVAASTGGAHTHATGPRGTRTYNPFRTTYSPFNTSRHRGYMSPFFSRPYQTTRRYYR